MGISGEFKFFRNFRSKTVFIDLFIDYFRQFTIIFIDLFTRVYEVLWGGGVYEVL
jgi:hypothetical protein